MATAGGGASDADAPMPDAAAAAASADAATPAAQLVSGAGAAALATPALATLAAMATPVEGDAGDAGDAGDVAMADAEGSAGNVAVGEDDEDEVVQECDVYLNRMYDPPDFVGDLYVLQYPLRPDYRPYGDQGELDRVDLKERGRRLRFTHKLTQNDNYSDEGAANETAQKHVLDSTVVTNPACSYAIAVIHQGRMTITPVRAVNQLRPNFDHIDRQAARFSKATAASSAEATGAAPEVVTDAMDDADAESGNEEQPDNNALANMDPLKQMAPVTVEYHAKARSWGGAPAAVVVEAEEPWTRLKYYPPTSTEAKDIYFHSVVWSAVAAGNAEDAGEECSHPKLQKLELDGDPEAYLKAMCGEPKERKAQAHDDSSEGLSAYVLSRMPVEKQVEAIVRALGVVSYARLRTRLPPGTLRTKGDDDTLIQLLRRCAVLVSGNWVLKSEIAGFEGAEAHARDMLLMFFAKKGAFLEKKEYDKWNGVFHGVTQRTAREEMTKQFATADSVGNLRLKNPADNEFIKKFASLAAEYDQWWESKKAEIIQKVSAMRGQGTGGGGSTANALASAAARQRAGMLVEARAALSNGAMNVADIRKYIQRKQPTVVVREEEVLRAMQESPNDVMQVRGLWLLSSTGSDTNDQFRNILLNLFRTRDSVSRQEIFDAYEKEHGKKCQLSDYVMRSLLREIADRADGDNFVIKGAMTAP